MHGLLGQKGPHTIPSIWGQKQASLRLKTLAQASNRSMMAASTLPKLETSLSKRMRDVYVAREADDDLDKEYGDNQGGPPKNRRAGKEYNVCDFVSSYVYSQIDSDLLVMKNCPAL